MHIHQLLLVNVWLLVYDFLNVSFLVLLQIKSPHDKEISKLIDENSVPWDESWELSLTKYKDLLVNPYDEIMEAYFNEITKYSHFR